MYICVYVLFIHQIRKIRCTDERLLLRCVSSSGPSPPPVCPLLRSVSYGPERRRTVDQTDRSSPGSSTLRSVSLRFVCPQVCIPSGPSGLRFVSLRSVSLRSVSLRSDNTPEVSFRVRRKADRRETGRRETERRVCQIRGGLLSSLGDF